MDIAAHLISGAIRPLVVDRLSSRFEAQCQVMVLASAFLLVNISFPEKGSMSDEAPTGELAAESLLVTAGKLWSSMRVVNTAEKVASAGMLRVPGLWPWS